jgi:hypothetical protein
MNQLFCFPNAVRRDPDVDSWMHEHSDELGAIAKHWFELMRNCGDDVRELLHDGHPSGLLEGTGKFMRHVKLRPEVDVGTAALSTLIETAYADMKARREKQ